MYFLFFHSCLAAFLLSRFTSSVLPPYSWVLRPLLTSCHSLLLPLSGLTRPPRVRVHSFTSCNCRLYIRRFRLVFGLRIILHSHPLRLPIDDFCSSVQGFAICFFQPVHHCTHLADSLALPTSGRARDFHPLDCTHAEHTKNAKGALNNTFGGIKCFQQQFRQLDNLPCMQLPYTLSNQIYDWAFEID